MNNIVTEETKHVSPDTVIIGLLMIVKNLEARIEDGLSKSCFVYNVYFLNRKIFIIYYQVNKQNRLQSSRHTVHL